MLVPTVHLRVYSIADRKLTRRVGLPHSCSSGTVVGMTDDLVRRIRTGDISAFEEVFRALHAPLCEIADSVVHSQAVAEEVVQELFFTIWQRRATLEAGSLRAYLIRAVRNRALHHVRHSAVVRSAGRLVEGDPEVAGIAAAAPLPDVAVESSDAHRDLRLAMDALPPRSRLALQLRVDHGMPVRTIAESMGVTVKGVEKLLSIARRRLREVGISPQ